MSYKIVQYDTYLKPYEADINFRMDRYYKVREELLNGNSIVDFANGYKYFGIQKEGKTWVYREWAPGASEMFFTGDFNEWNPYSHPMKRIENGVFEIYLDEEALWNDCYVQAIVRHEGQEFRRVPSYATRVLQDPEDLSWTAVVNCPEKKFRWTDKKTQNSGDDTGLEKPLYIYECHIGMSGEKQGIESYEDFKKKMLPRIKKLGYNTIQIMAVMEHPYYGSFGYQVTNFFAASSRYGRPEELKKLINQAHKMGIRVLLDVVHSHVAKNTNEGINQFDGTTYQYFHEGAKGEHREWDTKLFDYGKHQVMHFLLSNLKYWMMEYHFDGFRFDGVTSMLYHDHGMGSFFDSYDKYFSMNTHVEAITYLQLANELIHGLNKNAITIAEDMSAMPGMCIPIEDGGVGFDYRLAMGIPPLWIDYLTNLSDEQWNMYRLWYELTSKRPKEKVIAYVESHDQALVGDKTMMFRLCDQEMYWSMSKSDQNLVIDRGIALHKMMRFITLTTAGQGYLNFMGNEFGHPEWIDFPREGNAWSYHYCRRQWNLVENKDLKYEYLNNFDREMIAFSKENELLKGHVHNLWIQESDKIIIYAKHDLVFVFSFNPIKSFTGYFIPTLHAGDYEIVFSTDDSEFGGFERIDKSLIYEATPTGDGRNGFIAYIPNRMAMVFKKIDK